MQQRALSMVTRVVLAGWCASCLCGCGSEAPQTTSSQTTAEAKPAPASAPAKPGRPTIKGVPGGKGGPD